MKRSLALISSLFFLITCQHKDTNSRPIQDILNKGEINSKNNTDNHPELLALLPYKELNHIKELPLNLIKIRDIKKSNYELDYHQAKLLVEDYLDSLVQINTTDHIIYIESVNSYLTAAANLYNFDQEYLYKLSLLENLQTDQSTLRLYAKINYLIHYQSYLQFHNLNFHALAAIEYALHLLELEKEYIQLPYLKAILLRIKASILINEDHPGAQSTAGNLLNIAYKSFMQLNRTNDAAIAIHNLANVYENESYALPIDSLEKWTHNYSYTFSPLLSYYSDLNLGYLHEDTGDMTQALRYYISAFDKLSDKSCTRPLFDVTSNLIYVYIELDSIQQAESLLSKFDAFKTCDSSLNNYSEFYRSDILLNLQKKLSTDTSSGFNDILELLIKRRNTAKLLFKADDEFHLDDFYIQNCCQILDEFYSFFGNKIPGEYHELIFNTVNDSKKRELKRQRYAASKNNENFNSSQLHNEIQSCLKIINDFNASDIYDNTVYEKLFKLYESKSKTRKNISAAIENQAITESHSKILESDSTGIQEFIIYGNKAYSLVYNSQQLMIKPIKLQNLELAVNKFYKAINEVQDSIHDLKSELNHLLAYTWPKSINRIYLLPDGFLSALPLEYLLFEKHIEIIRSFDYKLIHSYAPVYIPSSDIKIFSYSNRESLNSVEVKSVPELYYGYNEALEIQQLFPESEIYSGSEFNRLNFTRNIDKKFIHLATHGYSNKIQRSECFFVMRTSESDTSHFSYTDITSMNFSPLLVNLGSCESGLGQYVIGAGTYSLSRAFLEKGTQTVIKTLWQIDDKASSYFMKSFYMNWLGAMSLSEALNETKLNFQSRKDIYKHPYYWAGFVLEGNPDLYIQQ